MKKNKEDNCAWKKLPIIKRTHNDYFRRSTPVKRPHVPRYQKNSLACVTLVIILDIRLYIVNPMHGIEIHGEKFL